MRELIVTIQKIKGIPDDQDPYLATAETDNGTKIGEPQRFSFTTDSLVDLEPRWIAQRNLRNIEVMDEAEPDVDIDAKLVTYGQKLYDLLFDTKELEAFLKYNEEEFRNGVRLTLALDESAALLWRVPWEYMHDGKRFIALSGRILFSRRPKLPALSFPAFDSLPSPLRVLIVVSSPNGVPELDTEREIELIKEMLADENKFEIKQLACATLEEIHKEVKASAFDPHIIHYSGHGVYDGKKEKSCLALEDENREMVKAYDTDLEPIVRDAESLRLLFLSGCQTAQASLDNAFSGVATGLLEVGVPAVIAMQFSILDTSAINLSKKIYSMLAQGENPMEAVYGGRQTLKRSERFDWGTPALYLRQQVASEVNPITSNEENQKTQQQLTKNGNEIINNIVECSSISCEKIHSIYKSCLCGSSAQKPLSETSEFDRLIEDLFESTWRKEGQGFGACLLFDILSILDDVNQFHEQTKAWVENAYNLCQAIGGKFRKSDLRRAAEQIKVETGKDTSPSEKRVQVELISSNATNPESNLTVRYLTYMEDNVLVQLDDPREDITIEDVAKTLSKDDSVWPDERDKKLEKLQEWVGGLDAIKTIEIFIPISLFAFPLDKSGALSVGWTVLFRLHERQMGFFSADNKITKKIDEVYFPEWRKRWTRLLDEKPVSHRIYGNELGSNIVVTALKANENISVTICDKYPTRDVMKAFVKSHLRSGIPIMIWPGEKIPSTFVEESFGHILNSDETMSFDLNSICNYVRDKQKEQYDTYRESIRNSPREHPQLDFHKHHLYMVYDDPDQMAKFPTRQKNHNTKQNRNSNPVESDT